MEELKEKVSTLEAVLGAFIVQSEKGSRELREEMKGFKDEMQKSRERSEKEMSAFKEEMQKSRERSEKEMSAFKEEMQEFKNAMQKSGERSEKEMQEFKDAMQKSGERSEKEMKEFKEEMQEFKDELKGYVVELQESRERSEKETKEFKREMNKKWGELANKMGTIVEDIAAPGLKGVLRRDFNIKKLDYFAIRLEIDKNSTDFKEFDVIAYTEDIFAICDIKTTVRQIYVDDFIQLVTKDIFDYFPEHKHKKLIPVFSSFHLHPNTVKKLTKHRIYAMVMGDDNMELLNKEAVERKSRS